MLKNKKGLTFREKVLFEVLQIPKGKLATYREIARKINHPQAYRAVGNVLNKNCDPSIPCHRVIRSDGTLGGYNRGEKKKQQLLKREGAIR